MGNDCDYIQASFVIENSIEFIHISFGVSYSLHAVNRMFDLVHYSIPWSFFE